MDRIDEFVAELEALEKKYGLYVWALCLGLRLLQFPAFNGQSD